jgi:hypothetical protein
MSIISNPKNYINLILLLLFFGLSDTIYGQEKDSSILLNRFGGAVTISTKGISTIPNLTLGKPAMVFDMMMGRRLTFEPQFRFALDGKPWAMVFWWRYKIFTDNKFTMDVRANYSISYKTFSDKSFEPPKDAIRATRYLAAALSPNFQINKYIGVGMYLFYNHGIEKFITRNSYMASFRPGISNIPITENIVARIVPEIYYLKMDTKDGMYLNSLFFVTKKNFPLSVSALINKPIKSNIPAAYDLLWNASLIYTFNKTYMEKR